MGALLGVLIRGIIAALTALFGGWKGFFGGFLVKTLLVIVLYNLVVEFFDEVLQWVVQKLGGITAPGGTISSFDVGSISSLGAWLVSTMRIPECLAFIITVIILKWTLRKIPFIRW